MSTPDAPPLPSISILRQHTNPVAGWPPRSTHYCLLLCYAGREMATGYHMGPAHTAPPEALEVLHSLFSDAQAGAYAFDDFAREFDYNPDSRRAHQIWTTCRRVGRDLHQLLGADYDAVEAHIASLGL